MSDHGHQPERLDREATPRADSSGAQPSALPAAELSMPHAVPLRTLCGRCAYDLAGLDKEGVCPECGEPIRTTLELLASLAAAGSLVPERQAKRLRAGLRGVALGVLLGPPTLAVAAFAAAYPSEVGSLGVVPGVAVLGLSTLGWLVVLYVESTPAPGFVPMRSPGRGRELMAIRLCIAASLVLGVVGLALPSPILSIAAFVVSLVVWTAGFATHYSVLSERRAAMESRYLGPDAVATWIAVPLVGLGTAALALAAPAFAVFTLACVLVIPLVVVIHLDRALSRHSRRSSPRPAKEPPRE